MGKKYRVSRYIFLALAILTNAFLVVYSCLSAETTATWNNFVTNLFAGVINRATEKEVKVIPIEQLDISISNDSYNNIPGYQNNEIPLGSSKELISSYLPLDATDKAVSYYLKDNSIALLSQSGSKVSIIGMKEGSTKIHAKNSLSGLDVSYDIKVVPLVAPTAYDISLSRTSIPIGSQETIIFDIDGGPLGHNELLNFRYYDIRELSYSSSNEAIATINEFGVIKPISVGTSLITVSNGDYHKEINISVTDGITPSNYTNLHIEGSSYCYGNDMLNDQNSHTNNYPLSIYDGDTKLDNNDFIWESSNELLLRVDSRGIMRGFRKSKVQDEEAVVTATSKITGQSVTFDVAVKEELPTTLNHWIVNGDKTTWGAPKEYTTCVGDSLILNTQLTPSVSNKNTTYTVSNEDVIECTYQGSSLSLRVIKEGTCAISISSIANPELVNTIKFTVIKAGSIDTNELEDVGLKLRKTIGHASVFGIAAIFTLIAAYMFLYDKKHWITLLIALGTELVVASTSELVQHFVPSRNGSFTDVGINMLGAVIGIAIVVGIYFIVKLIRNRKNNNLKN